jgi:hypothetical protein
MTNMNLLYRKIGCETILGSEPKIGSHRFISIVIIKIIENQYVIVKICSITLLLTDQARISKKNRSLMR